MQERWAAFVRNVMIGREGLHRSVLVGLFEEAGAEGARSYISTGNVTFSAAAPDLAGLATEVEDGIEAVIGRREEVYVRSIAYLDQMVASDPFAVSPFPDAVERMASFVRRPIEPDALGLPVLSRRQDVAVFGATAGEVFSACRMIDGRTSSGGGIVEKLVGQRVTTRSWNTIVRVVDDPL